MVEAIFSSETSVLIYAKGRNIPEDASFKFVKTFGIHIIAVLLLQLPERTIYMIPEFLVVHFNCTIL
jgi:hypothetical protein